jgi:hypothetical protein
VIEKHYMRDMIEDVVVYWNEDTISKSIICKIRNRKALRHTEIKVMKQKCYIKYMVEKHCDVS